MKAPRRTDVMAFDYLKRRTMAALKAEEKAMSLDENRPFKRPTAISLDVSTLRTKTLLLCYAMDVADRMDIPHQSCGEARMLIDEISALVDALKKEAAR